MSRNRTRLLASAMALVCAAGIVALADPHVSVVTDDAAGRILLHASFDEPRLDQGRQGLVPRIEGLETDALDVGHPLLPRESITLVLPPGTRVGEVRVAGTVVELPGRHRVAWGQPPVPVGHLPGPWQPADPEVYGDDAPYPRAVAELTGEGTFRGYRVATLRLAPLQYRPTSGRLLLRRSLEVVVHLEPAAADSAALPPRGLSGDRFALGRLAANPEAAKGYGAADGALDADEPYLIVCPDALRSSFQRLLDHRAARGMPGRIMTTEEIVANYSGVDDAEKVREAIREAYQQRGTTFVLLGGDDVDGSGATLVPYRGCLFDAGGYRYTDAPSDFYFGALDGNWNADGDNVWCEPDEIDYYTEVHIGRATVDTPAEADRFIDKLLTYEAGLAEERRRDLVFMGESLDSSTWGGDSMDVTAGLIPEDEYDITKLYEREGTFSRSAVISNLNRGPHLTNHLGHASSGYVMGINRSDVDGLTNESPFFSYSQGCDSGAFDEKFSGSAEAISEHFLTAENAGFGVVMNSRYGWYSSGSTNGPSQMIGHEFFDALFTEGMRTLGEANDDSRHDNASVAQTNAYRRWCFLETNLHGDPATPVQVGGRFKVTSVRVIDEDPRHGNENGLADPGETVRLAVTLENLRGEPVSDVEARLSSTMEGVTVRDQWARWPEVAAHATAENLPPHFSATMDVTCGTYASFSLEIRHSGGETEFQSFFVLVGEREHRVLFEDQFENDGGWTVNGDCQDGEWVRGVPQGTMNGGEEAAPDEDAPSDPGTRAFVTGNEGVAATDDDVDGGDTVLTSPTLDATGYLDLTVTYDLWYYVSPFRTPPLDRLTVEMTDDGGASWRTLEELTRTLTPWERHSFRMGDDFRLADGVALRVTAGEYPGTVGDTVIEAGLDNVVFDGDHAVCQAFEASAAYPPAPVGDTLVISRSGTDVRLDWQEPPADPEHDAPSFYRVERGHEPGQACGELGDVIETFYVDWGGCEGAAYDQWVVTAWNPAGDETP